MKKLLWVTSPFVLIALMVMVSENLVVETRPHASSGLSLVKFDRDLQELIEYRCMPMPLDEKYQYCQSVIPAGNIPAFQKLLKATFLNGRE